MITEPSLTPTKATKHWSSIGSFSKPPADEDDTEEVIEEMIGEDTVEDETVEDEMVEDRAVEEETMQATVQEGMDTEECSDQGQSCKVHTLIAI